jgi:hypothetical protein
MDLNSAKAQEMVIDVTKPPGVVRLFVGPILGYAACYLLLTFPLVLSFSKVFWCNTNDGYQMVWNLWWVRHALLDLHQLPWYTPILKYPDGVTLLLHSLAPFDGLLAIPLNWLGQVRAYNTIIIFTFAASGLTAFWLAYDQTRAYWPSLIAGYAFTFSAIHFAHASGHLHQISNEFVPLFLLLWLRMVNLPTVGRALAAAICLFLVLLCDHYLFCYCVIAGVIAFGWRFGQWTVRDAWKNHQAILAACCFLAFTLCTCGTLMFATIRAATREPLVGEHNPEIYSPSFVGLILPGWQWEWHDTLAPIWTKLGSYEETTTSIGIAVVILAIIGIVLRKRVGNSLVGLWITFSILFTLFALGPTWRLWYEDLTTHTPYRLLMWLIPSMRYSGCPGRMMVVTQLSFCMLAATGLKAMGTFGRSHRLMFGSLLLIAMVIESKPRLPDTSTPDVPQFVEFIRDFPGNGPVIDDITRTNGLGLYFQTIHHHPVAGGYVSRVPQSIEEHSMELFRDCETGNIAALSPFQLIVVAPSNMPLPLPIVYQDRYAIIYENPGWAH